MDPDAAVSGRAGDALLVVACLVTAGAAPSRPLWKGSRFTIAQRDRAVQRGVEFIYRTARDGEDFDRYASDYLWFFFTVAEGSADPLVRRRGRTYGKIIAERWRRANPHVPPDAGADDVSELTMALEASERLGVRSNRLRGELEARVPRFSANDFLDFDPRAAPPPRRAIVLRGDEACAAAGSSGTDCPPVRRTVTDYDVWYDAMITVYFGDRFGVTHGASFADLMRWRPSLQREYALDEAALGEDAYYDLVYLVTHIVYTHNDYGTAPADPSELAPELAFLRKNLPVVLGDGDGETFAELVETLTALGVKPEDEPAMGRALDLLMGSQNPDGSWGDAGDDDIYNRYHTTWTAIDALREHRLH